MMSKRVIKVVSKSIAGLGLILLMVASYIGYSSFISEIKSYIEVNNVSVQQLNSFYSTMQRTSLVFVFFVSGMVAFFCLFIQGKFRFRTWIKWSFIAMFTILGGLGYYLYDMKQTGFYNNLLIPILPVIFIVVIVTAAIYISLPDEFLKELWTKEGRKEISRRLYGTKA